MTSLAVAAAVAAAGIAAGLNPCCLPLYPGALGACGALRRGSISGDLGVAGAFVFGVALATASLGLVAGLSGRALAPVGGAAAYLLAVVPLLAGLHLLGALRLPLPSYAIRVPAALGALGAVGAGAALALLVTPCSTPVLASALAAAGRTGSAVEGAALLFVYGLGQGVPILAAGFASAALLDRVAAARATLDRVSGALLVGLGLYLLWLA